MWTRLFILQTMGKLWKRLTYDRIGVWLRSSPSRKSEVQSIRQIWPITILTRAPRLLVRTPIGAMSNTQFPETIPHPSPELADYLGKLDICLYGTDALRWMTSKATTLPGHTALLRNSIAILESLDLNQAPDGLYRAVCTPSEN